MIETPAINDASEIISRAVHQSKATGKVDLKFAMAIMAYEILTLRDSLRECLQAVDGGSGDLPEPVLESAKLALGLLPPDAQPADQLSVASES